jgi:hypothetical protein
MSGPSSYLKQTPKRVLPYILYITPIQPTDEDFSFDVENEESGEHVLLQSSVGWPVNDGYLTTNNT